MESVSDQVTKLAANASPAERKKILDTLESLYQTVETPENARFRLQMRACQSHPLLLPLKEFTQVTNLPCSGTGSAGRYDYYSRRPKNLPSPCRKRGAVDDKPAR